MFKVIPSEEINYRIDFPLLCTARGVRIAIEMGTDQGVFAKQFMERFTGTLLICVDSYEQYEWRPKSRDTDKMTAVAALMPWHGRFRIVEADSVEAAKSIPDYLAHQIDFVYIDGKHDYDSVKRDIKAWWPKVSEKGILAGHDYDNGAHPGVVKAVNEFAKREKATVRITEGDPWCNSWYVYKNEPKELIFNYFRHGSETNPEY